MKHASAISLAITALISLLVVPAILHTSICSKGGLKERRGEASSSTLVVEGGGSPIRTFRKLLLKYRIHSRLIYDYGGGEFCTASPYEEPSNEAYLTTLVERVTSSTFRVTFTLNVRGQVYFFVNGNSASVNLTRSVTVMYDPHKGYWIPGGSYLGYMFPLFTHGEELEVSLVWARIGEEFTLDKPLRRSGLRLVEVVVWNFSGGFVRARVGNRSVQLSFSEFPNKTYLEEVGRLLMKLGEMGGSGEVVVLKSYANSTVFLTYIEVENSTGIPVFLELPGAMITSEESEIVWNGGRVYRVPASPLALLLGVRNDELLLDLVDVEVVEG